MVHITDYLWVDDFIDCRVNRLNECNEYSLTSIVIPNINIRLSYRDGLIFVMEIPSDKDGLFIESGPGEFGSSLIGISYG